MESKGSARVHYFDRQFLRPEDFSDEQAYHVAMHRRHNIAHHTWGIVEGLDLKPEENAVFVQPGYAIDGYGRDLILARRTRLPVEEFDRKRSDVLDVWLLYSRDVSNRAPLGYAGCGPTEGAQYRSPEVPVVRMEKPDISYPDRRKPKGVPVNDQDFSAVRLPPDDFNTIWPVFLGQVTRTGDPKSLSFVIDPADRPYVGLVGEAVLSPSGQTRLQIGRSAGKDDKTGFAVFVRKEDPPGVAVTSKAAQEADLQIDNENGATLRGNTQVYGDVKIVGGALEFSAGTAREDPPTVPQPWKIYVASDPDPASRETELRIEMGDGGGPNRVSIGVFSEEEKKFSPCLSIDQDCTVTVEGNLVTPRIVDRNGNLPEYISAGITNEAQAFVLATQMSGIGGSVAILDRFFKQAAPAPNPSVMASLLAGSAQDIDLFVREVKNNTNLRDELLRKLSTP